MKPDLFVYWIRRDFRIRDNPALSELTNVARKPFVPVFFLEPYMYRCKPRYVFSYCQRYFIAKALEQFSKNFQKIYVIFDYPIKVFKKLANIYNIKIFVNEDVHPDFYKQIEKIRNLGIQLAVFKDQLTVSSEHLTSTGNIYSVFTPFKKAVWEEFMNAKEAPPAKNLNFLAVTELEEISVDCNFDTLWSHFDESRKILVDSVELDLDEILGFKPELDDWYWSETEALNLAGQFCAEKLHHYHAARNMLDRDGTSKLSLALTWGLVSARSLKNLVLESIQQSSLEIDSKKFPGPATFISELIWREFYKYLFFHYPWLLESEFQESKRQLEWVDCSTALERFKLWIQGRTGYSIVDAGMMEIAKTGFMHNRTRMIVASILTKNLGVDWRWGQEYFRAALIDLDDASNNGGWQWSASVGADPKPIRIFNPYLQAEKFDPKCEYRKKWLGKRLKDYLEFGGNLPPIIEHEIARREALERYGLG